MFFKKKWRLKKVCTNSNCTLFGVNIFDYQWVDTKQRVQVSDLSYEVPVYTIMVDNVQYEFAAGERSNCVWNFYLYKF